MNQSSIEASTFWQLTCYMVYYILCTCNTKGIASGMNGKCVYHYHSFWSPHTVLPQPTAVSVDFCTIHLHRWVYRNCCRCHFVFKVITVMVRALVLSEFCQFNIFTVLCVFHIKQPFLPLPLPSPSVTLNVWRFQQKCCVFSARWELNFYIIWYLEEVRASKDKCHWL